MSEMTFGTEATTSNKCGVTLMNTPIGQIVSDVMKTKPGVELVEYPSMIRVEGGERLVFNYDEIADEIGEDFNEMVFEEISSTHYGRMVHLDEETIIFANPEDAAEHIGFNLKVAEN